MAQDKGNALYRRVRRTRFYGGSTAADLVGCQLRCARCWSGYGQTGDAARWLSAEQAAVRILRLVVHPVSCLSHAASTLPVYVQENGWAVRL